MSGTGVVGGRGRKTNERTERKKAVNERTGVISFIRDFALFNRIEFFPSLPEGKSSSWSKCEWIILQKITSCVCSIQNFSFLPFFLSLTLIFRKFSGFLPDKEIP